MTANEITETDRAKGLTASDLLYDAVETLVDTIYRHEEDDCKPVGSLEEAQKIAAETIRAVTKGAVLVSGALGDAVGTLVDAIYNHNYMDIHVIVEDFEEAEKMAAKIILAAVEDEAISVGDVLKKFEQEQEI